MAIVQEVPLHPSSDVAVREQRGEDVAELAAYSIRRPPRTSPRRWERFYVAAALALDALASVVAGALASLVHLGNHAGGSLPYGVLSLGLTGLWIAAMALSGAYRPRHLGIGPEEFNRVLRGALGAMAALGVISLATDAEITQRYVVVDLLLAVVLGLLARYGLRKHVHRRRARGGFLHRTIVVGQRRAVESLVTRLRRSHFHGYQVVGACLTSLDTDVSHICDTPVIGLASDVVSVVESTGADTVLVVPASDFDGDELRHLSWALSHTGASVAIAPGMVDVVGPRTTIRPVEGVPLLQIEQPDFGGVKRLVKQVYDPLVAAVALVALTPLFLIVGLAIKMDSEGPVFFRQTRVGRLGKTFTIVKFRTMVVDAEQRKDALAHLNEGAGPLFKVRNDPRVTRVGAILRKTSLDELPQLFNVLVGQMSLVGPRPHLESEVAEFGDEFRRRLLVKPGMTGLWQVSGRSDLSFDESVRVDLRYVENWSLGLDVFIVWKTVAVVLRGSGAY